ncbi:MAG: signal peptidase I [Leptospiraceae bacterium]|nr:signal peptidase I [Leptospiraceae bacterium]MCP5512134.1 signal peptidase I [Leptospiraceae bacterium]
MYSYKRKDSLSESMPGLPKLILRVLISLILAFAFSFFLKSFVIYPHRITDSSMFPSFKKKDLLFFSPIIRKHSINYGDVLAIRAPNQNSSFIGRVIGLPGDKLSMKRKKIYRNGKPLTEKGIFHSDEKRNFPPDLSNRDSFRDLSLKENEYFVLCDNRDECMDSRDFGSIGPEAIQGKLIW